MILICVVHMLIKLTLPKHTNVSHYFLFFYLVSICFYTKEENLYLAGRLYLRSVKNASILRVLTFFRDCLVKTKKYQERKAFLS